LIFLLLDVFSAGDCLCYKDDTLKILKVFLEIVHTVTRLARSFFDVKVFIPERSGILKQVECTTVLLQLGLSTFTCASGKANISKVTEAINDQTLCLVHLFLRGIVVELELATFVPGILLAKVSVMSIAKATIDQSHGSLIAARNFLKLLCL
jgi:hypothetical protein